MPDYSIKNIDSIATPALIYYTDIVRKNIELAIKIAGDKNRIRSHVKSHKTVEIPKIQAEYGINKFKTATIAETEMLAQAGFKDIFMAYPLVGPNIGRFVELCKKYPETKFIGLTDNLDCAQKISEVAKQNSLTVNLLLDIDSGMHRTGASFSVAETLYPQISRLPGIKLAGLHVYDGENKNGDFETRFKGVQRVHEEVAAFRRKMEKEGLNISHLTMGGTPSFPCHVKFPDVEVSPGTCFLQDAGNQEKLPDLPFTPAAVVATRVVSITGPDLVTFDMGSKSVASDPPVTNRGKLLGGLQIETVLQNEEHWVVRVLSGKMPKVGDVFYVIPTHICPTSALYERIAAVDENRVIDTWYPVASRQRKITV